MDISTFLARFWGLYFIVFFLVLVFNPKRIKEIFSYLSDKKFLLVTAFVAIIMGILNILFHNVWVDDWRLLITLIGWTSAIVGITLFTFPTKSAKWFQPNNVKFLQVLYLLLLLLGAFLLIKGYN